MNRSTIVSALDAEIIRLQQALVLIAGFSASNLARIPTTPSTLSGALKKRTLSAAGRRRIAEAQKKRWATKRAARQEVDVERVPPKQQRERKPRTAKQAPAGHALSSRSGMVAVPAKRVQHA